MPEGRRRTQQHMQKASKAPNVDWVAVRLTLEDLGSDVPWRPNLKCHLLIRLAQLD